MLKNFSETIKLKLYLITFAYASLNGKLIKSAGVSLKLTSIRLGEALIFVCFRPALYASRPIFHQHKTVTSGLQHLIAFYIHFPTNQRRITRALFFLADIYNKVICKKYKAYIYSKSVQVRICIVRTCQSKSIKL